MKPPLVYVETTIPSFYFDERQAPEIVAQRHWTRAWWAGARRRYDLVTSVGTWGEILRGPTHRQIAWIELLREIQLLPFVPRILEIEETYIAEKLMPGTRDGDAFHLAFASYYECDYLVTWNYRHLANANKFQHIRTVNRRLGLFVPEIVTPRALMGGPDDR
jgi:predicted nucleic acid-binding protein